MTAASGLAGLSDDDREAVAELFAARVRELRSPGVAFAVFDGDGIRFEGGFGERSLGGAAPDSDTAFRIASCTKSFTAATTLLLRDRGLLNLDAPITDFVPAFRATVPSSDPVVPTVRMLLTMSAGLPSDDPWGDRQESISTGRLTELLTAGVPFVTVPGTSFEYSNLGYALLGQVIEAVTGRPYIEVVRSELLVPLGLDRIRFEEDEDAAATTAIGYRRSGDQWLELPFSSPGVFSPIGGIFATPRDLARWARWLASALDPEKYEPGPLSAASRREMQQINRSIVREPAEPAAYGYGFGLFVEDDPVWGKTAFHSGGYPGFSTHMIWNAAAGIGIVGFENATYSRVRTPVVEALRMLLDRLGHPSLAPAPWPQTLELRDRAEKLILAWDDTLADEIFAENIALDEPYPERVAAIARVIDEVGGVTGPSIAAESTGESPAHLVWHLPARRGRVRCEILLAPTTPARIQSLEVTAEPQL